MLTKMFLKRSRRRRGREKRKERNKEEEQRLIRGLSSVAADDALLTRLHPYPDPSPSLTDFCPTNDLILRRLCVRVSHNHYDGDDDAASVMPALIGSFAVDLT